jgi:hypothetical protein
MGTYASRSANWPCCATADARRAGPPARLLSLSVDGLILAASLVLLHEARNDRDAPGLARLMLWLGIGATIGANIAFGAGYGLLGALISAWPAVAFIGSVEIAMQQVRRSRAPHAVTSVPAVPGNVEQAVRAVYMAPVAAGQPLSQRAMAERFGLSRRRVSQLVTSVSVESNGHTLAGTGGMSVNRYGVMARRHWTRWLPEQYAAIGDPESFFTTLGEEVARQIDDLADELAGEIGQSDSYLARMGQSDSYLARMGQLLAAWAIAEELILPQRVLPQAELTADDDQEDAGLECGKRPVIVDRIHPSWADVNAEQEDRASAPEPG